MKDILHITLRLGNVSLSLNIPREEEATFREASKQVNHAWEVYSRQFDDKTPPEIMAMVALLFAKGYVTASQNNAETAKVLAEFENRLDELLLTDQGAIPPADTDI